MSRIQSLDDQDDRRYEILEEILGSVGEDFYMQDLSNSIMGKHIYWR